MEEPGVAFGDEGSDTSARLATDGVPVESPVTTQKMGALGLLSMRVAGVGMSLGMAGGFSSTVTALLGLVFIFAMVGFVWTKAEPGAALGVPTSEARFSFGTQCSHFVLCTAVESGMCWTCVDWQFSFATSA